MIEASGAGEPALVLAEKVAAVLARRGVDCALIGAMALAAHFYPRSTEDVDLAIGVHPGQLDGIAGELRREGFSVEVSDPDSQDPLGGVLRVSAEGTERVEVVNFCNPPGGEFPALVEAALRDAVSSREGSSLRVVTLPHLIVFKLYAGGPKSKSDVLEVLSRNPGLDLDEVRAECRRFRLDGRLQAWLRDLKSAADD